MTDAELTAIYNEANGIGAGKNPSITTQRIFAAMRFAQVNVLREAARGCEYEKDANRIRRMADELEQADAIRGLA